MVKITKITYSSVQFLYDSEIFWYNMLLIFNYIKINEIYCQFRLIKRIDTIIFSKNNLKSFFNNSLFKYLPRNLNLNLISKFKFSNSKPIFSFDQPKYIAYYDNSTK